MEITKACTVVFLYFYAFWKQEIPWFFDVERNVSIGKKQKKTEDGENLFFKASANRFWLKLKCYSWFNKVVHGRLSIKWTSWKGNDRLIKVG